MHKSDLRLTAPPLQYELAIDHAPPKVRSYGYRDAHSRPLVSRGKRGGVFESSFRVAPWDAWGRFGRQLAPGGCLPVGPDRMAELDCDPPIVGWVAW